MANDTTAAVDMLKELLSSPDAGEKISSMLSALGMGDTTSQSEAKPAGLPDSDAGGTQNRTQGDEGLPLPVSSIVKLTSEYQKLSRQNDPRVDLLRALRPYLRPHRRSNLDNAIKILSLVKFAPLLSEFKDM